MRIDSRTPEARYFWPISPFGEYFELTFLTLVSPIFLTPLLSVPPSTAQTSLPISSSGGLRTRELGASYREDLAIALTRASTQIAECVPNLRLPAGISHAGWQLQLARPVRPELSRPCRTRGPGRGQ